MIKEWGVFEDVYCAGSEKTFQFFEDVFDEVISLFPSEFILWEGMNVRKKPGKNARNVSDGLKKKT